MQSGETLFGINRWRHLIVPDLHKASLLSYWLFRVSKGEDVDLRLLFKVHNLLFLKHVKQTDRCETDVSTGVTLLLFTTISECFTQQKKERASLTLVFPSVMKTSKKKLNPEWSPAWKHDCEVWIFLFVCLWWRHNCEIQQFLWSCAADHCQKLLNYQKVARIPRSSVRSKSSFMPVHTACVHEEAGVVAGQWRPLRLRLHCCPLVNDRAVGSCSSVYAVIKHSKPTGWQQAHFLAPGLSVQKETCLMLCFPAQCNPTREERYKRKCVWFWGQILCISTDSQRNFSILCFSGVTVDMLGILTRR